MVQYNRDVICLPHSYGEGEVKSIIIPRGSQRSTLANMGLQGKVTSAMSEEEIRCEIRSAFTDPMGNDPTFPFTFLQLTGGAGKTLAIP